MHIAQSALYVVYNSNTDVLRHKHEQVQLMSWRMEVSLQVRDCCIESISSDISSAYRQCCARHGGTNDSETLQCIVPPSAMTSSVCPSVHLSVRDKSNSTSKTVRPTTVTIGSLQEVTTGLLGETISNTLSPNWGLTTPSQNLHRKYCGLTVPDTTAVCISNIRQHTIA